MKILKMRFQLTFFLALMLLAMGAGEVQAQKKEKPADYGIKSKQALKFFQSGREQGKFRSYENAIELYKKAVEIEPKFAQATFAIGASYYALHDYEKGIEWLNRA
ncbi:MAG: tetratricopeptide repeat protein, partial [Bacteroidota bacterium]